MLRKSTSGTLPLPLYSGLFLILVPAGAGVDAHRAWRRRSGSTPAS